MRKAKVNIHKQEAGLLTEHEDGTYTFRYLENYKGEAVSLTMPVSKEPYVFDSFPPYFDGLLPEGTQLEGLIRTQKLDRTDYFGQLIAIGSDLVGAVTVYETGADE